jgi:kynurenine formamidase
MKAVSDPPPKRSGSQRTRKIALTCKVAMLGACGNATSSGEATNGASVMAQTDDLPDNWGRWGENDESGTLNLITDAVRARAGAEVRTGRAVSLAMPVRPAPIVMGPSALGTREVSPVQQLMALTPDAAQASADVMIVTNHALWTHLDALSHQAIDGLVYPGRPMADSVTPAGVTHGSTAAFASGVVTRGVLLDLAVDGPLAGGPVTGRDLDAAEERQGVTLEPGDALVLRGGRTLKENPPVPGVSVDAVRWMHRRGVSLYTGDIGDARPPLNPGTPAPLHKIALVRLGMPLIDAANVEELAAVCTELSRYSFLLAVAPPRILGMSGIPVNPLAIF